MTASEIRERIIEVVAKNGGHLAPSLGAVEIAIALSEVFDPEKDRIIWDVGHQAYAWKLLTGRDAEFATLRTLGGISGFPNPLESNADAAIAGHAGVAISVAEGYAAANRLLNRQTHVVAVSGDSSIVNGTSLEALNNCASSGGKVIVVLNDNGMSISKPTGSISKILGRIIAGQRYNRFKRSIKIALGKLRMGFLYGAVHNIKAKVKSFMLGDNVFEQLGMRYIGPVDGHDVSALKEAFEVAASDRRSVFVHVVTKKGKGFAAAENDPTSWHGVGPFMRDENGNPVPSLTKKKTSWSDAFGEIIMRIANEDSRVVALTAGMKDGTGLTAFADRFSERFFDVGIAEGHLMSFAAGLAAGGTRPVVAIYSTFLQRAVDQLLHDIAIASLPVVICVDRAGCVGQDGVTHQGLYDISMLRAIPNLVICQPKDAEDFELLLREAFSRNGPTVIRYPRGSVPEKQLSEKLSPQNPKIAIWTTGDWYQKALAVAAELNAEVVCARYIKPFDAEKLAHQRNAGMKIISIENGAVKGGLGEAIGADLKFGWPDEFIPHGQQSELEKKYSLDVKSITAICKKSVSENTGVDNG
jgi:1-deoxy-D-xylulose-5-phosphate synthase